MGTSSFASIAVAAVSTLVLAAALATLINVITAEAPPISGLSCKRECQPGETHICAFEFDVQRYQTYSRLCGKCTGNKCEDPHCVRGDGTTRFITTVNRMLPGPSIEVCEGDLVQVKVRNQLPAEGVSIHWHGILHKSDKDSPSTCHMDGVPGVTQCPILPGTSFTYTFEANPVGTHFWYAHTGFQRGDGVFGSLIVRRPTYLDVHSNLYDEDLSSHAIVVNDWTHILSEEKFCLRHLGKFSDLPQSLLVNGIGPHEGDAITAIPKPVPHKRFAVVKGLRYRFRMISAAFLNCPIVFTIENHKLKLIEMDGVPVESLEVDSLTIHPGERIDFVLEANGPPRPHWMVFTGKEDCAKASVYQLAILDYVHGNENKREREYMLTNPYRKPRISFSKHGDPKFSYKNFKSVSKMEDKLKTESNTIETFYFYFNRRRLQGIENHPFFSTHPNEEGIPIPQINNVTFGRSSSPLLQKRHPSKVCTDTNICQDVFCECLHLKKIALGTIVDLVLIDKDEHSHGNSMHLHGHRFFVIGSGQLKESPDMFHDDWKSLYANQKLFQNIDRPIMKDTVAIPPRGYVVLRFQADNPGFWLLQSQLLFYSEAGMKVVMMVGEDHEIPSLPREFPRCGNYP